MLGLLSKADAKFRPAEKREFSPGPGVSVIRRLRRVSISGRQADVGWQDRTPDWHEDASTESQPSASQNRSPSRAINKPLPSSA